MDSGARMDDEKWSGWSNNQIARKCAVSHTMVNNMRDSLETVSSHKRKVKRGDQEYTVNTSNIGKRDIYTRIQQYESEIRKLRGVNRVLIKS